MCSWNCNEGLLKKQFCQIMHKNDFDETIQILNDVGFKSNNSDVVKVNIKAPKEEN